MNIFALHHDPEQCAKWYVDRHIVKMINESAQLLSNAVHFHAHRIIANSNGSLILAKPVLASLPKPTHYNHKCSIWTMQSGANFKWLTELLSALLSEYTYRYERIHKYQRFLKTFSQHAERLAPGQLTPWAQAMPAFMQSDSPNFVQVIDSYRKYYAWYKWHLWRWKNRKPPTWLTDNSHWPPSPKYAIDRRQFHAKMRRSWLRKRNKATTKRVAN